MNFSISSSDDASNPVRYVVWLGATFIVILALVACVNAIVDPYRVFRLVDAAGLNELKPRATQHGRLSKEVGLSATRPMNLILGNSRAEVGFDPQSPLWPGGGTTYNAALPGSGPQTALDFMQRALTAGKVRNVLIGVDFPDFLVDPDEPVAAQKPLAGAQSAPAWKSWLDGLRMRTDLLLSTDALVDSALTLAQQGNPDAPDLTRLGFNPLREYPRMAKREGYWALFRQRDEENARRFQRMPKGLYVGGAGSSNDWEALREIVGLCVSRKLRCTFVIYPYHAHMLDLIEVTGLWDAFEGWKRELVRIIDAYADRGGTPAISLWDFSGYHRYAGEDVPLPGDRSAVVEWYWEAGHFKRKLGDRILDRLYGAGADAQFGARLTSASVEQQLADIRRDRAFFRKTHPAATAGALPEPFRSTP